MRTAPIVLIAALLLAGCRSRITGNEGNFEFSYVAEDDVRDFNKPIAVGARLDLSVVEIGTRRPVTLSSVESDNASALRAVGFEGQSFTLEGTGEGEALISVTGTTESGKTLPDSVNMQARPAEILKLAHTCVTEESAQYLTGQKILVPFELERENGQPTIGYGYYPVTMSPAAGLVLDPTPKAIQFLHLLTGESPGTVTIQSTIDSTSLRVELVDAGAIEGAEIVLGENQETRVDEENAYFLLPLSGGRRICQANTPKSVSSETPSICSVRDRNPPLGAANKSEFGWLAVKGLSEGTCRFSVTYPRGNGGAGVSVSLTVAIAR